MRTALLGDRVRLGMVVLAATLGLAWGLRNYRQEHQPHVLVARVREIESRIRGDGASLWLLMEDNAQTAHRDAILRDFERLAHLEAFRMTDVHAETDGDRGRVTYRIQGVSNITGVRVPSSGEMGFVRDGAVWRLQESRLFERK